MLLYVGIGIALIISLVASWFFTSQSNTDSSTPETTIITQNLTPETEIIDETSIPEETLQDSQQLTDLELSMTPQDNVPSELPPVSGVADSNIETGPSEVIPIEDPPMPDIPQPMSEFETFSTEWNDYGGGHNVYLDRHNIDCVNKGLSSFKLKTNEEGKVKYEYTCNSTDLGPGVLKHTKWNAPGFPENDRHRAKGFQYLDRHDLSCDENHVMSRIHFNTNPDKSLHTVRYAYKCHPKDNLTCTTYKSPSYTQGEYSKLTNLPVKCETGMLNRVKLSKKDGKYHYDYTCCE